ncbi:MAG: hypothetical protein XXXJIFNMEKO3_LKCDNKCA_00081 (plasmid) [Candidatus Erwinia impunctatus]
MKKAGFPLPSVPVCTVRSLTGHQNQMEIRPCNLTRKSSHRRKRL